jgi:hypothetical protein
MQENTLKSSGPWWKYGHVWLVLGGPAVVVVACFVTAYLAVTRPDPLVSEDYYRRGIEINQMLDAKAAAASLAPAGQARNHAATGVAPLPAESVK